MFWQRCLDCRAGEIVLETLLAKIQRLTVWVLAGMLVVIVLLSTAHLGIQIGEEI
jgi:hypothetical protein